MFVRYIRAAIQANGGTPQSHSEIGALRELVTAYGGTPTKYTVVGLLREAITAVGGTPTSHEKFTLIRQLLSALGAPTISHDIRTLYTLLAVAVDGGDVTAPVLTSPTDAANGSTGATLSVTTDEGNGTLYWFVSTSATPPSATNLKTGTGATASGTQAVSGTGVQNVSATGLTASTAYYAHFLHRDAAGNDSAIVSGNGFTTDAAPVGTTGQPIGLLLTLTKAA